MDWIVPIDVDGLIRGCSNFLNLPFCVVREPRNGALQSDIGLVYLPPVFASSIYGKLALKSSTL